MDSGTVMEGTEGTFGGGMVPRRARTIPSHLALEPFNPKHASVPAHRKPAYQCAPSKVATHLRWRIHFRAGVGVGPPQRAISSGGWGSYSGTGRRVAILASRSTFPNAPNLSAFLRVMGLRLNAMAGDPLHSDAFVSHLVAHFVANVGVRAFVRGSAVSAVSDGQLVDILSVAVGCDGCANGCPVHFSPVGLLWARHPGEDAKRPLCHCGTRRLVF